MSLKESYRPGLWVWLFPVTYLIHIAEEFWVGDGFHVWVARFGGGGLEPETFVALNATALVVMTAGTALVRRYSVMNWLVVAFGTTLVLNGVTHLLASVYTVSYSPGLISGNLLWVPLGIFGLWQVRRWLSRQVFRLAIFTGALIHAAVIVISLL